MVNFLQGHYKQATSVTNPAYKTAMVSKLGIKLGYTVKYVATNHGSLPLLAVSTEVLGHTFNVITIHTEKLDGVLFYIHEIPKAEDLFADYNPKRVDFIIHRNSRDVADLNYVANIDSSKIPKYSLSKINKVIYLDYDRVNNFLLEMMTRKDQIEKANASANITSSANVLEKLLQKPIEPDPYSSNSPLYDTTARRIP